MLSAVQEKLLQMMKWFHAFCVEHNLTYYITGGTLLGAVRHEGFIPWDDDVDILLPRPDYERLMGLLNASQGQYILEGPYTDAKDFLYTYCKLFDTQTTYLEDEKAGCVRGVFLDIFPLDGAGRSKQEASVCVRRFRRLYDFYLLRTVSPHYGFVKNTAVRLTQLIPFVDNIKIRARIDQNAKRNDYESALYVTDYMFAKSNHDVLPKEVYGQARLYRFENAEFFGPADPISYLVNFFGDWQSLPPEEDRKAHEVVFLDLEKSYLEYKP